MQLTANKTCEAASRQHKGSPYLILTSSQIIAPNQQLRVRRVLPTDKRLDAHLFKHARINVITSTQTRSEKKQNNNPSPMGSRGRRHCGLLVHLQAKRARAVPNIEQIARRLRASGE